VAREIGGNSSPRTSRKAPTGRSSFQAGRSGPRDRDHNAGWTHRNKPYLEVTEGEFDKVYAVNVKSV